MAGLALLAIPSLAACRTDPAPSSNSSAQPSGLSSAAPSASAPSSSSTPPSSSLPSVATSGSPRPQAAPACRAADLHVAIGSIGAGAGQRYTTLVFHTLHGRTCALRNDLTDVHFLRGDGTRLPTHVRRTGDPSTAITLHPDMSAHLAVHFTVVDPGRSTPRLLEFTVPGGGTVTVAWPHGQAVGDHGMIELGRLGH